ncbi:MAG: hypothetical protein QOJ65_738 [Fimbriimonadaceae bacterium]|nr:hypothetical protein [Fimbriimonadaceae bacterium]
MPASIPIPEKDSTHPSAFTSKKVKTSGVNITEANGSEKLITRKNSKRPRRPFLATMKRQPSKAPANNDVLTC